jgi:hypothetical protein
MFSILKMEAICSSETSVDTQRATRRYIPEDGSLQVYVRSYMLRVSILWLISVISVPDLLKEAADLVSVIK